MTIPLTAANQGGATSADYGTLPAAVTFGADDTEQTFTFSAVQDTDNDDDESVVLGFGTTCPPASAPALPARPPSTSPTSSWSAAWRVRSTLEVPG